MLHSEKVGHCNGCRELIAGLEARLALCEEQLNRLPAKVDAIERYLREAAPETVAMPPVNFGGALDSMVQKLTELMGPGAAERIIDSSVQTTLKMMTLDLAEMRGCLERLQVVLGTLPREAQVEISGAFMQGEMRAGISDWINYLKRYGQ